MALVHERKLQSTLVFITTRVRRGVRRSFMDLNIFVRTQILRFGRTQCFREGFTQSFINKAPVHYTGLASKTTYKSSYTHSHTDSGVNYARRQLARREQVGCLAQGHLDTQLVGYGDRTSNLSGTSQL